MCENERTVSIRKLNDQLRTQFRGGHVVLTQGIQALGQQAVRQILASVATFDGFNDDNDPYEEHDCAALEVAGVRVNWKIDYYDRKMWFGSPDPADADVTERVMTVMLAEEY